MTTAPKLMAPELAAKVLVEKLASPERARTVADASAESGLPLRDAASGLTHLTAEYRGHLRVTDDGDLLYVFPNGFSKPWETRERWQKALTAAGRALVGVGRFVVRAWLLIAMVAYAAVFVALVIALSTARRDERGPGLSVLGGIFRAIADALFWTVRPFSPVYAYPYAFDNDAFAGARTRRPGARGAREEEVPFYERVNRFVFGPKEPEPDPLAVRASILAEIRALKGRVGLSDVMRVTGLPREEADPLMARLMLDHDGEVEVSDAGGIYYVFPEMRRTANAAPLPFAGGAAPRARAAWDTPKRVPPLTGNSPGHDLGVGALNAFNLLASGWVMAHGLTVSNIMLLLSKKPPLVLPQDGTPIALGVVPFVFSLLIFAMPVLRALKHKLQERTVAMENARLQIMREVLTRASKKEPVPDEALKKLVRVATGIEPTSKEITREVVALGGDVDAGPNGEIRYRFADLEAEAEALEEERAHAPEKEAKLGRIVFASDD